MFKYFVSLLFLSFSDIKQHKRPIVGHLAQQASFSSSEEEYDGESVLSNISTFACKSIQNNISISSHLSF